MKLSNRVWLFIILLITSVLFYQTLQHEFVNWDDATYIQNNELIKDLSIKGIKKNFNTPEVNSTYVPITILTWAIDYKIGGEEPFQYHLTNLLFHLINIVLVFILMGKLFESKTIPIVVAALFAIHPMNVEVVSWLSARKDLVYVFFFLLSIISYVSWKKTDGNRLYIVTLAMFLLSLFSKGSAIMLPFVLILIDYLLNQLNKKSLFNKIPFFVLSLIFGIIGLNGQTNTGATTSLSDLSFLNKIAYGFTNYLTLILNSIIPYKTSPFHPQPFTSNLDFPSYLYLTIPMFIIGVVLFFKKFKSNKTIVFGMLFFLVTILPVIQFLPFGMAQYGDRYVYLPYLGLFVIVAVFLNKFLQNEKSRKAVMFLTAIYAVVLIVISYSNIKVWKNGKTLWASVINKYPKSQMGYNNAADYYRKNGEIDKAIGLYNESTLIANRPYLSYNQLGFLYNKKRNYDLAVKVLNKSILLDNTYAGSYLNRGVSNLNLGRLDLALDDFNSTLKINPNTNAAYYNRGFVLSRKGDNKNALNDFSRFILEDQRHPKAYEKRGEIYLSLKKNNEAYNDFSACINLNGNNINCLYLRGTLLLRERSFAKAIIDFESILKIDSKHLKAGLNRGVCLMNLRKFKEAVLEFDKIVEIAPEWGLAYSNRALAYENLNKPLKAKADKELAKLNGYLSK
jgi:tetratricopeptide (TPR) repeat protein